MVLIDSSFISQQLSYLDHSIHFNGYDFGSISFSLYKRWLIEFELTRLSEDLFPYHYGLDLWKNGKEIEMRTWKITSRLIVSLKHDTNR